MNMKVHNDNFGRKDYEKNELIVVSFFPKIFYEMKISKSL